MKQVWKYPLTMGINEVLLPAEHKIVHVALQHGNITMWAEVSLANVPYKPIPVSVVGTGHDIPEDTEHVGTFMDGPFVWHVYV